MSDFSYLPKHLLQLSKRVEAVSKVTQDLYDERNILLEEVKNQQRYIADLEHLIELIRNFYPDIEEMPFYKELFG